MYLIRTYPAFILFLFFSLHIHAQEESFDTTVTTNHHRFTINMHDINDTAILFTVARNSKILLKDTLESGASFPFTFTDINKDGYQDILITYLGNNIICSLYLYDNVNDTYKRLKNFENYPEAIQLKSNPAYYYSYHRAGCADANWVSDLFTIKNFKTIWLGHIYGYGCPLISEDQDKKDTARIEIYKILNNNEKNKKLLKMANYVNSIYACHEDKWEFIKEYWNENCQEFK